MKKLMVVTTLALIAASLNAMSLQEARGLTDKVIENPSEMTAVMKQLTASDQKSFVADVNEAISKLPGSAEEKSAKVVDVTRAAFKGASRESSKDLVATVAEVFATAPLESLCVLNENLGQDSFNRAVNPKNVYTDEQFAKIASNVVNAVNSRVAGLEDADVRGGFAALMMIRASNGTPESLADDLADTLGESAEVAKKEWFPEALKTPANYDPMLSGTSVDSLIDSVTARALAGNQRHEGLVSAMHEDPRDVYPGVKGFGDMALVPDFDHDIYTLPRTTDLAPWNPDLPHPYKDQKVW